MKTALRGGFSLAATIPPNTELQASASKIFDLLLNIV